MEIDSFSKLDPIARKTLEAFFDHQDLLDAYRLVREKKISISFRKGDFSGYFVVSGIITDGSVLESRISCKSVDGQESKEVNGHCSCLQWKESAHCSHVASLFIKFLLQKREVSGLPSKNIGLSNIENAVRVGEYGTIITGPDKFQGSKARGHSTYFVHQYCLTDQNIVPFPLPCAFQGQIIIRLYPTYKFHIRDQYDEDAPSPELLTPRFSYITKEGNQIDEVSIFETLYLFDWINGESYYLPKEFVDFIKTIEAYPKGLTINNYLRLTRRLRSNGIVTLMLEGTDLSKVPTLRSVPKIFIAESGRNGFFDFTIRFYREEKIFPVFDELASFAFQSGDLNTFKKKSEAYDFLENMVEIDAENHGSLFRFLRSSSQRDQWETLIKSLYTDQNVEYYDGENNEIYFCESSIILQLLLQLIRSFGAQSFRFGHFFRAERMLLLQIRKSKLLEEVTSFFTAISSIGIEIYFNQSKIGSWKSQVKCQRKESGIDWFEIDLEITEEDLEIIQSADLEAGHFWGSKGVVIFDQEQKTLIQFLKRYIESDKDLRKSQIKKNRGQEKDKGKNRKFHFPLRRAQIFELFELKKLGFEGFLTEEEVQTCERLLNLQEVPLYSVPQILKNKLRPYQIDGYRWLRFLWENRFGACLADDMGLGKTIQTISFLQSVIQEVKRVLIVCPVSILVNWQQEFKKFSSLSDEICLYYGEGRELDLDKKIILISYGVMKREAETRFGDMKFDIMVLDEIQNLKNIRSLGAASARKIKSRFHICLTGTPVENNLGEFFNILDLSVPGIWGQMHSPGINSVQQDRSLIKKIARPFILRRTKSQVLPELPAKIENTVYLRFSDREQESYLHHLSVIRKRLEQMESKQKRGEVFKGLLELRQLCLWQQQDTFYSTKVKFLLKSLEQILQEDHQVLIFSQFTEYLDIIQSHLVEKDIEFSRIDGSFSLKKRTENIELFQSGQNRVFLISLRAGGLGLNLTAASYVYIMDPWWNPAVETQAVDRAHRIGQKKSINVYRLIMKNSIEEKVLDLQKIKRRLFEDLLGSESDEYFSGKLTMKDFEALLIG